MLAATVPGIAARSPKDDVANGSAGSVADLKGTADFNSANLVTDENSAAIDAGEANGSLSAETNGADTATQADNVTANAR